MRSVRFIRSGEVEHAYYLAGEVAGFVAETAERLVSAGMAAYVQASAAPSEGTPPSPADGPSSASEGAALPEEQPAPLLPPEPPPDPAVERAAIEADNVSRTTPKSERKRR